MNIAYIGLGSNIKPRATYLKKAIDLLQSYEEIELTGIKHFRNGSGRLCQTG